MADAAGGPVRPAPGAAARTPSPKLGCLRQPSDPGDEPSSPHSVCSCGSGRAESAPPSSPTALPALLQRRQVPARAVARVAAEPVWDEAILREPQRAHDSTTAWVHTGRGLPSRTRARRRADREAEELATAQADEEDLTEEATVAEPPTADDAVDDAVQGFCAAFSRKFAEFEADQSERLQAALERMQSRVCDRLDAMFGTSAAADDDGLSEAAKIRLRRRQRGRHRLQFAGDQDASVVQGGAVAYAKKELQTLVDECLRSSGQLHAPLLAGGVQADNAALLRIVEIEAVSDAERQVAWLKAAKKQKLEMSTRVFRQKSQEMTTSMGTAQEATEHRLDQRIREELAAAEKARRLTSWAEKERAETARKQKYLVLENEQETKLMRMRSVTLAQRLKDQRKYLETRLKGEVAKKQKELQAMERRLEVIAGTAAAATMGRAAERAQRDRKALLWQQRLAKSRAEASKIGGSVASLRRR